MTINIDKLRKAHAATKERTTPNFRKLSNKDLRGAELPFTAYEVDFHFNAQRDRPYKATIHEIKITRFGVAPRCSSESVDFMSRGQRCIGSADLFYPSREDAQAYADWVLEDARAVTAQEDFQALAHNEFPALLDEIERLRKAIDREHTAKASPAAKTIKLADLIDNTRSIVKYDPSFAEVYLREKAELLKVLTDGDQTLWSMAKDILDRHLK